jgi:segregation and condensation protein A
VGDVYEGPLDLLLGLIRKQDIDIYDIPIAKITAQYLAYVEKIKQLDVDVAAEFIYMAAVLIHIKSKMLLPRDPLSPADAEEDPRAELVNRLLEHEKFKSAVCMFLALLEMVRLQAVQLRQERVFGEILLRKHVGFDAVMSEQAAMRDDWR